MRYVKRLLFAEDLTDKEFIKVVAWSIVSLPFVIGIIYVTFAVAYLISLIGGGY